jgi:hypothetical protein
VLVVDLLVLVVDPLVVVDLSGLVAAEMKRASSTASTSSAGMQETSRGVSRSPRTEAQMSWKGGGR